MLKCCLTYVDIAHKKLIKKGPYVLHTIFCYLHVQSERSITMKLCGLEGHARKEGKNQQWVTYSKLSRSFSSRPFLQFLEALLRRKAAQPRKQSGPFALDIPRKQSGPFALETAQ